MRRNGSVALGAVVALALSACGGGGTTTEPSESAPVNRLDLSVPKKATAEGPAENLVLPEAPTVVAGFTEEGLEAFVEYWFDVRNYAVASGDSAALRALSSAECTYCDWHIDLSDRIGDARGAEWIVGGEMYSAREDAGLEESERGPRAFMTLVQRGGALYDEEGLVHELDVHFDSRTDTIVAIAHYRHGAWTMSDFMNAWED